MKTKTNELVSQTVINIDDRQSIALTTELHSSIQK